MNLKQSSKEVTMAESLDLSTLRKYVYSVTDEAAVRLLFEIFSDALAIIETKDKLKKLEQNLFSGERMQYIMEVSPFENDDESVHMAVTILKNKINSIDLEKESEQEVEEAKEVSML